MKTGTITWTAPIQGLDLKSFKVVLNQFPILKVEINTENDTHLNLTFTLQDIFTVKEAVNATHKIVELFASKIALAFLCRIGELQHTSCSLPTKNNEVDQLVLLSLGAIKSICDFTIKPTAKTLTVLSAALQQPPKISDSHLLLFRFSILQDDPVTKFMFLYNLMLSLNNDCQKKLDKHILTLDDQVPVTLDPRNSNKRETLFTRLRNEVAHSRPGRDQIATATEIERHVGEFELIVQKALL